MKWQLRSIRGEFTIKESSVEKRVPSAEGLRLIAWLGLVMGLLLAPVSMCAASPQEWEKEVMAELRKAEFDAAAQKLQAAAKNGADAERVKVMTREIAIAREAVKIHPSVMDGFWKSMANAPLHGISKRLEFRYEHVLNQSYSTPCDCGVTLSAVKEQWVKELGGQSRMDEEKRRVIEKVTPVRPAIAPEALRGEARLVYAETQLLFRQAKQATENTKERGRRMAEFLGRSREFCIAHNQDVAQLWLQRAEAALEIDHDSLAGEAYENVLALNVVDALGVPELEILAKLRNKGYTKGEEQWFVGVGSDGQMALKSRAERRGLVDVKNESIAEQLKAIIDRKGAREKYHRQQLEEEGRTLIAAFEATTIPYEEVLLQEQELRKISEDRWRNVDQNGVFTASVRVAIRSTPKPGDIGAIFLAPKVRVDFCYVPPKPDEGEEASNRNNKIRGFWLGRTEVLQRQWVQLMEENPSLFDGTSSTWNEDRAPVIKVTWTQAQQFVEKLNSLLPSGYRARLPSAAEWRYACRAGAQTKLAFGNDETELGRYARFRFNTNRPGWLVAGSRQPNAWGLRDMLGCVWEWCADEVVKDGKPRKIILGGGWRDTGTRIVDTPEGQEPADTKFDDVGFRLVLESI